MDVRGAQLHRALDDQVDQADHRGLAGAVAQLLDVLHLILCAGFDPREDVAHLALALAMHALDGGVDFRAEGHLRDDPITGRQAQRFAHEAVLGVGHGHPQRAVADIQRQGPAFLEEAVGQAIGQQRGFREVGRSHPRQAQQLRPLLSDVLLGNQAEAIEQGRQRQPFGLPGLHAQHPVIVGGGQTAGLDQRQPEVGGRINGLVRLRGKHGIPASGAA